jgi:hypothetical protein
MSGFEGSIVLPEKETIMSRFKAKKQVIPLLLVTLFLVSTGCSFSLFDETTATPQPPVTVVVTKVITQIVPPTETPIVTDVPVGTLTPSPTVPPIAAGTYDPFSVQIYYPIEGCPASRLHIGDRASVTIGGGPNAIRFGSDVHYDNIIGHAQEGEGMLIVDGPWCYSNWIVWQVKTDGGLEGFTPEGNGEEYWLIPELK